jgi:hypothetical protein
MWRSKGAYIVMTDERMFLTMAGSVQALDTDQWRLDIDVYGIAKHVEIGPDCRVSGRGITELKDVRPGEWAHVNCQFIGGRLQARAIEIYSR